MDSNEVSKDPSGSAASADSASEGKFSFRDLMKAAEEKHPAAALRDVPAGSSLADPDKIDGPTGDQIIYELTEIIEESPNKSITVSEFNAEIMKKVSEIAERVAREMFPEIAERIIQEEIAKLKAADE
jgi:hypothetical protein